MSDIQAITYRGRTLAAATTQRVFLADELERRPAGDPEVIFVTYMALCAADVLAGRLPDPYSDQDARAYARGALIPPEVLERPAPAGDQRLAHGLGVPLEELRVARAEHVGSRTARPAR